MTTATVRVTFGQGTSSDPHYVIELDDTLNLDTDGEVKTTFAAGDTIWFLLHVEPGYRPTRVLETNGQATLVGQVSQSRTDEGVFFSPENSSNDLSYYPVGGLGVEWKGNSLDLAQVSGRSLAAASTPTLAARADISYPVDFYRLRFDPPALVLAEDESYQIDVLIQLERLQ